MKRKLITLFFLAHVCFIAIASHDDSLSVQIERYANSIADNIIADCKSKNPRGGIFLFNGNSPIPNPWDNSAAWIQEKGMSTRQILSAGEFSELSQSLNDFHSTSILGAKVYVTLINDLQIAFNCQAIDHDTLHSFDLNRLNKTHIDQQRINEYERVKKQIGGGLTSSVLTKLLQAGVDTSNLILYNYYGIRGYDIGDIVTATPHNFQFDRLAIFGGARPYKDVIWSRVKDHCIRSPKRPYYVVKALLYALNSLEVLQGIECDDDIIEVIEKTHPLRAAAFLRDIDSIAAIVSMSPSSRSSAGFSGSLFSANMIYTGGIDNYLMGMRQDEKLFYKEIMGDKVKLLEFNSDYKLYYLFSPVNYCISEDSAALMTQQIHQKAGLGSNDILVFLPYFAFTCGFGSDINESTPVARSFFPSVFVPDNGFRTQLSSNLSAPGELHNKLLEVFKGIPKHHIIHLAFINYEGDLVISDQPHFEENVPGHISINEFVLGKDERYEDYKLKFSNLQLYTHTFINSATSFSNPLAVFIDERQQARQKFLNDHPVPGWEFVHHNLREISLTKELCKRYAEAYYNNNVGSISAAEFIGNFNEAAHQEFLGFLDGLSLVLSVAALDILVDAYATIYCYSVGDMASATIYGASVLVPVGTGGEMHMAKDFAKGERYVYRSVRTETALSRRSMDDLFQLAAPDLPAAVREKIALPVCRNVKGEVLARIMTHQADPLFENFSKHLEEVLPDNTAFKQLLSDAPEKIDDFFLNFYKQGRSLGEFLEGEGATNFGIYSTKIDNSVEVLQKESLFGNTASTFLDAEYRTVRSTQQVTLFRSFGGNAKIGGTFVTTTEGATKSELALLDEWNNTMRFEASINVPIGTKMNIGKVGPQTSIDGLQTLNGGADQVVLPFQWDTQWVSRIVDNSNGRVYNSLSEFAVDFPNLIN